MPLADFVRYLNSQLPYPPSGLRSTTPFVSEAGQVHVRYSGLRLESIFCPVVDTVNGGLCGHGARLQVTDETSNRPLDPALVYTRPADDKEFIYLDRLVRTLHTLNYLTYRDRQSRQLLLLKVHPRHVASVAADHGLAFEEILRSCGLMPEQITLEFDVVNAGDIAHLVRAIGNYKSRGYSIAIGSFGHHDIPLDLLREIAPTLITLDPQLVFWTRPLGLLVDQVHRLGVGTRLMIEGPDSPLRLSDAKDNGIDLLRVRTPSPRLLHVPAPGQPTAFGPGCVPSQAA